MWCGLYNVWEKGSGALSWLQCHEAAVLGKSLSGKSLLWGKAFAALRGVYRVSLLNVFQHGKGNGLWPQTALSQFKSMGEWENSGLSSSRTVPHEVSLPWYRFMIHTRRVSIYTEWSCALNADEGFVCSICAGWIIEKAEEHKYGIEMIG